MPSLRRRSVEAAALPGAAGGLADEVYRHVLSGILDGSYPLGFRLPTETELAQRCSVSRPVVRQALLRLREDGVIATRQGSGSIVVRRPDASFEQLAPLANVVEIQRCYEFRIALEGEIAALAAQRRSLEDLAALERALGAMESARRRGEPAVEEDFGFHLRIAGCLGNPVFIRSLESLRASALLAMGLTRRLSAPRSMTHFADLANEHRRLLAAIEAGDAPAARNAAREHIQQARRRMFEPV